MREPDSSSNGGTKTAPHGQQDGGSTDSPSETSPPPDLGKVLFALLLLIAVVLLVMAAVMNTAVLGRFLGGETGLDRATDDRLSRTTFRFLWAGMFLIFGSLIAQGTGLLRRLAARKWVVNFLLLAVSLGAFLFVLENALRPFFPPWTSEWPSTSIFMEDEKRGWRLRPDTGDIWGGEAVAINSSGFRGPVCPQEKPPGEIRVLCLGDSLTFGYYLKLEQSYPALIEHLLNSEESQHGTAQGVAAHSDSAEPPTPTAAPPVPPVRVINAGVGGYSPWQSLELLRDEGLAFEPDLVMLGFVLNDVVEKFELRQFGGSRIGFQLEHSHQPGTAGILLDAASRFMRKFSIYTAFQRLYLGIQLGPGDPRQAATRMEELNVLHLVSDPESELVRTSWELTLENVEAIARLSRESGSRFLLVVFPYRFQLAEPMKTNRPQQEIRNFTEEHGIEMLDLLPLFAGEVAGGRDPKSLFVDQSHPTALGSNLAAGRMAEALAPLVFPGEQDIDLAPRGAKTPTAGEPAMDLP